MDVYAALAAVPVYALIWVGYRQDWGWLHCLDWSMLNASHDTAVKHPAWLRFWEVLTNVLGPVPLRVLDTVAAVAALAWRNGRAALLLSACGLFNGLVTQAAKALADRPRPSTMLVPIAQTSFPSGHALETTASLLALLAFVVPMNECDDGSRRGRGKRGDSCAGGVFARRLERALPVRRGRRLGTGIPLRAAVPGGVSS